MQILDAQIRKLAHLRAWPYGRRNKSVERVRMNERVDTITHARARRDQATRQQYFAERTAIEIEPRLRLAKDREVGDATEFCHNERPTVLTSPSTQLTRAPSQRRRPGKSGAGQFVAGNALNLGARFR